MKPNVGNTDRIIRAIAGVILILLGLFVADATLPTVILLVLGVILVATAAIRFCPLYLPFKINTLKK